MLCNIPLSMEHFYPRPPRGGRLYCFFNKFFFKVISIHALREEGDAYTVAAFPAIFISIHALREEGDVLGRWWIRSW